MAKAKKTVKKATSKKASAKKSVSKTTKKAAAKKPTAKPAKKVSAKSATVYKLNVGDKAPSFSGASTSGQTLNQDVHSKKTLVLYFYPKDNTPGCTLEGQDFRRLYKKFQDAGVEIVGVSQDSLKSHDKFKSKCDFPFELLSDEDGSVCRAFDVMQMKSMYGRDFLGIERSTFLIKNGVVRQAWRKVRVDGHAQEVLSAAQAL